MVHGRVLSKKTSLSQSQPIWLQEVVNSYVVDENAQKSLQQLALSNDGAPDYSLKDDVIRFQVRIWIGSNVALKTKLIFAFHASAMGGHSGIQASYHKLMNLFAWTAMKQDVVDYIHYVSMCPLPIPSGPWTDITMNLVEAFPKSNGYTVILVIVNRFTKYSHFIPLKHPFTALVVAQAFFLNVVRLHGRPQSIVSDRDKIFTSSFWNELFKLWNTKSHLGIAYHP
jgi:hypothetical protein